MGHIITSWCPILLRDADVVQLHFIRIVLSCFEAITDLKVNLSKNEIVPVGEENGIWEMAEILG